MADLEMNIAGRYDDYSDFGSNFSPKVSFRYQPLDKLTLRASFNEGYMAPQLPYVTKRPLVSTIFVNDPSKCPNFNPCPFQITETTQTNLELKAEDTEQFSLGLDYSPTDWVNISLDYYNIQVNNRIRFFNAQAVINADVFDELPSGLSCIRNSNGIIIECITGFSNQGKVETSGLDLNAQFDFEILGGHITSNLILSHLLDLSVNSGTDFIHSDGFPQQRSIFNNLYRYSDWSIAYDINMIGSQYDYIIEGEERGHVPTWVTHDLQLNYQTPWNGKITLGAKNIGEKAPPIGLGQIRQREYDFNLYDGFGRITYLRYTQTF